MNILFITPAVPNRQHRTRSLQMIKYLSRRHDVYLVALDVSGENAGEELAKYCKEIHVVRQRRLRALLQCVLFLFLPLPLEAAYCRNSKVGELSRGIAKRVRIDLLYLKRLRSAHFIDPLEFERQFGAAVILDTTDAMSLFYKRAFKAVSWFSLPRKLLYFEEWLKYILYEKRMFKIFKYWVACSMADIGYLRKRAPQNAFFSLIPNGVDMEFYRSDAPADPNTVVFSGLMDKFVNIEAAQFFAREVFPIIAARATETRLLIVGPKPARVVKKLGATKGVKVFGFAPSIADMVALAQVVVCPVRTGTGTRFKILQAWSIGRPVVTTSAGLEGLDAQHEKHVLIADNARDFAASVLRLLEDAYLREILVRNGWLLLREKYAMEAVTNRAEEVIKAVAS